MGGSVSHLLLSLPKQAWWLIAILAGLSLLGGGGKGKKKKKKKDNDSGMFSIVVIAGVILLAAGTSGGALKVPAVHHAVTHVFSASGPCSGLGSVSAGEINGSANALGISCKIVRAQINEESGGDPSSYSSAQAKGVAQFLQGTWDSHHCAGSPWNVADSMNCYVIYMRELIHEEGGVHNALAAYNAGPGNIGAGMGYADLICSAAGGC